MTHQKTKTENHGHDVSAREYANACERALQDIEQLHRQRTSLAEEMAQFDEEIRERRQLADQLLRLCDESRRRAIVERYQNLLSDKINAQAGGPIYQKTLTLFRQQPDKALNIREVRERLEKCGLKPNQKQVYNTLHRLAQKGALKKVGRGRYLAPAYGIAIHTSDEMLPGENDS